MAKIKAPFNFVPLNDKVYFPEWADKISHDIPFKEGESGIISLRITAQTPLFVCNGNEDNSFCKTPNDTYFIPSTSIKGAIRNVLETMSFGKMTQMENEKFYIRDLSNGSDGTFYRDKIKPENIHCGWLKMEDEKNYTLQDCGLPWRISAKALDGKFGIGLMDFVKDNKKLKEDSNRTAKTKYDLFQSCNLTCKFSSDKELRKTLKVGNRQFVKFDDDGAEGIIVFTGQPSARKQSNTYNKKGERKWEGKFYEFVFPTKIEKTISIDKYLVKEFISIHKNSIDYTDLWKKKLFNKEPIPVFFTYNQDEVDSLGLSYMYKYPAYNSIYDAVPEDMLNKDKLDLSECIFGTIDGIGEALKGRVSFSHAMSIDSPKVIDEQKYVLSTPHPSFYPLYLGNGQTWNSETIRIAGRKRYPVRNKIMKSTDGTSDMLSCFIPLDKGSVFECKLRFHNLKPVELGALLSALTFHNNSECSHSLGMGKPYGFGRVKIEVIDFDSSKYLAEFEREMETFDKNWKDSFKELLAMAKGIPGGKENEFEYMKMSTNSKDNEFKIAKEEYSKGSQLGTFTQIINNNVPHAKYIGNVKPNAERRNIEAKLQEEYRKKQESYGKYSSLINQAKDALKINDFENAEKHLLEAEKYTISKDEIEEFRANIRKTQEDIRDSNISKADELAKEAKTFYDAKDYQNAKAKYEEAHNLGVKNFDVDIQKCEQAISMTGQTFEEYLEKAKMQSSGAFTGYIKKWTQDLTDDDKKLVIGKIEKFIEGKNKNKVKDWNKLLADYK